MSKTPKHYDNGANYDVIDIANDYNLSFARGNAVKYIVRAGIKKQDTEIEDLEKAITCLEREINYLEKNKEIWFTNIFDVYELVSKQFDFHILNYLIDKCVWCI